MIQNFEDFCRERNTRGLSMGIGNAKGIFALTGLDWLNPMAEEKSVRKYILGR